MGISGALTVAGRHHLAALAALTLVAVLTVSGMARWGPAGTAGAGVADPEAHLLAWTTQAVASWQRETCLAPERASERWLHRSLAGPIVDAWLEDAEPGEDCDDVVVLRPESAAEIPARDVAALHDDGLPDFRHADAVWDVRLSGADQPVLERWWVVIEHGERRLFSLGLWFYARCALGEEEC